MAKLDTSQTTWNLSLLFENDNDPAIETEKKRLEQETMAFVNKWKSREDYTKNPKILKEALDEYEKWLADNAAYGKYGFYIHLRTSQDSLDTDLKAQENLFEEFHSTLYNEIQFFSHRISKIPKEDQEKFITAPELKEYKHFLERQFAESKYLLSEAEEKILNLKQPTSMGNWVRMTQTLLSKEEAELPDDEGTTQKRSFEEILKTASYSKDKKVRDLATEAFNKILEKHIDVVVEEINSVLQDKKINDTLRKTERPDTIRHLGDDIETEVVDALIDAVSSRNLIAQQFYQLKAKLLGVSKLAYNERNLEYGEIDQKYPYPESVELIHDVFTKLDTDFADIFKRMIENGQVDVHPRKGKRGGAFCTYPLLKLPTYILLNHNDNLNDVLTIAHEFGHAINGELVKTKQNALNFDTPMCTAEVASTFMEDFVLQDLLSKADDELKLNLLMKKLNDDISTIFRQVACYKFEQDLHKEFREKGFLSKEDIGQIFYRNMNAYMGDAVDQPEWAKNWWIYWSHIRSFFYVYSYASGLLISKSLQNSVKQNKAFIEKVKEFLSSGTNNSPKNIFKKMDVDITDKNFWDKGIDEINELLEETKKLAIKLGRYQ
jgi:oligoendopeptidase F